LSRNAHGSPRPTCTTFWGVNLPCNDSTER
jgi:hypothetical protein